MTGTGPKVYDLQAKYAAEAGEPFRFVWADREWVLPHIRDLDFLLQGEIEAWDPKDMTVETIHLFFERIFGSDQAADSSKSTGRPSKPTSTATTASGSKRRSTPRKRAAVSPPTSS